MRCGAGRARSPRDAALRLGGLSMPARRIAPEGSAASHPLEGARIRKMCQRRLSEAARRSVMRCARSYTPPVAADMATALCLERGVAAAVRNLAISGPHVGHNSGTIYLSNLGLTSGKLRPILGKRSGRFWSLPPTSRQDAKPSRPGACAVLATLGTTRSRLMTELFCTQSARTQGECERPAALAAKRMRRQS